MVLEVAYANLTRKFITSLCDFWRIANSVVNKHKSAARPLVYVPKFFFPHLIRENYLLETSVVSLRAFLLELTCNSMIYL